MFFGATKVFASIFEVVTHDDASSCAWGKTRSIAWFDARFFTNGRYEPRPHDRSPLFPASFHRYKQSPSNRTCSSVAPFGYEARTFASSIVALADAILQIIFRWELKLEINEVVSAAGTFGEGCSDGSICDGSANHTKTTMPSGMITLHCVSFLISRSTRFIIPLHRSGAATHLFQSSWCR